MKVEYVSPNGRLKLGFDCSGVKQLIKNLSQVTELLEGDSECGQCGSKTISLEHRNAQGFDFYGMRCHSCGGTLSFGQHKEGDTLFVKRDAGQNGWIPRYTREGGDAQPQQQRTERPHEKPSQPQEDQSEIPF